MHHVSCSFLVKHQITQETQLPYSHGLAPCDFWIFPKLKPPLKRKRFQIIDETQENTTGQLMMIGRTVWGPKVPTLKGTEASLSSVQYFLYLVSAPNVFFFILRGWIVSGQTTYSLLTLYKIFGLQILSFCKVLLQFVYCFFCCTVTFCFDIIPLIFVFVDCFWYHNLKNTCQNQYQ